MLGFALIDKKPSISMDIVRDYARSGLPQQEARGPPSSFSIKYRQRPPVEFENHPLPKNRPFASGIPEMGKGLEIKFARPDKPTTSME
ncbi:MAG: hypothetical protein OEZ03_09630 [Alphaproteobacteria bacterium]|nr:hypothetical protein [Alphaproteobacteria bacterium]